MIERRLNGGQDVNFAIECCGMLWVRHLGVKIVWMMASLWCFWSQPGYGAEEVKIRLGLLQTTVKIAELEDFSKTGRISPSLRPYRSVLTPRVQHLLNYRFPIHPQIGDRIIRNILRSPLSLEMHQSLAPIFPNTRLDFLEQAVTTALGENDFTVLSVLKAYPSQAIAINAPAAVSFALQFNGDYWKSRLLEPLLISDDFASPEDAQALTQTVISQADPTQRGYERVEKTTLVLRDVERKRVIPVDLYWATISPSSGPLVIISHGFGSDRLYFANIASHLASYGLTVAAIEHPGSNVNWLTQGSTFGQLGTLVSPEEFIDRPQDISFLLDRLTQLNHQPGSFQGKLNTRRVSLIGHSLGGYTAFVLAGAQLDLGGLRDFCRDRLPLGRSPADWLQCAAADLSFTPHSLKDERISQVIAISPLIGRLFGKNGIKDVQIPTLIVSNTNDVVTPALEHQIRPFARLQGSKYLLTAIGAPHLSVGNLKSAYPTSPQFLPLQQLVKAVSLAFIKQLTSEKDQYQEFLQPSYAESFSTPQIPLRLNQSLPERLWERIEVGMFLHWLG